MEISNLDKELLQENDFQLFNFLLHFTQSELQEEQRLATRGLSKLPLQILIDWNPLIVAPEQNEKPLPFGNIDTLSQNRKDEEQKTIKEDSSEQSMSEKIDSNTNTNRASADLDREENKHENDKNSDSDKSSVSNSISSHTKKQQSKKEEDKHSASDNSVTSDSESNESSTLRTMSMNSNKGNIVSLINSLSSKIKPKNNADTDIQYFSLYSIFNLLLQINIISNHQVNSEEEAKKESVPMDQKRWNDLSAKEFNMLLIDWNMVNNIIPLLIKSKDEDIVRISLKIIILLTFKVPMKNFMNFESDGQEKFWVMSWITNDTDNYNYYYNFQSFLGYVLHRSKKEDIDITTFMSIDVINQFVLKLCDDFKEDELLELNSKGNNSKKKMIIYKFFFVSYLISLLVKTLDAKWEQIDVDVRLGVKQLCYNFIEICQSIRISDMGLSKLLQNEVEEKINDRDERNLLKM